MVDDVLLNKAAIIERCLQRVTEEYRGHESELEQNFTRQDAIVLNLLRACEAAIDLAMHQVRVERLGLPQESREAFQMLEAAGIISPDLSTRMQRMIGFRNIAVHEYQKLDLAILRNVLDQRLDDFREFVALALRGSGSAQ
ncbi:type VII toxin-antitoxin system HepT family RNase toxin [Thermithiobacillus plumbiphilus]|uniref:DUF86 domain-containing protein n=1 Tax=Thermithiobacillus plumbiphilus TaxID=1729899 RepID=A0ABU9D549_9PROT